MAASRAAGGALSRVRAAALGLAAIAGLCGGAARAEIAWKTLEPGLDLARPRAPGTHRVGDGLVTLVRFDPRQMRIVLAMAKFEGEKTRTAGEWAREKKLLFAVNAGLYQGDEITNVGLMRDRRQINNPKLNHYRSVFAWNPRGVPDPVLMWDRSCEQNSAFQRYESLVQNIRLIDCKRKVTWPNAEKSVSLAVLAIDGDGRIIVAYSQSPHTAGGFARLLLRWPLDIRRAQYLEGGRPSQLYLDAGGVKIDINGLCGGTLGCIGITGNAPAIPNVLGVVKR